MPPTGGFAIFSSAYAQSDTWDLPDHLAQRMTQWRDETRTKTLRAMIDVYAQQMTVEDLAT